MLSSTEAMEEMTSEWSAKTPSSGLSMKRISLVFVRSPSSTTIVLPSGSLRGSVRERSDDERTAASAEERQQQRQKKMGVGGGGGREGRGGGLE
jgi:hypothetical protein